MKTYLIILLFFIVNIAFTQNIPKTSADIKYYPDGESLTGAYSYNVISYEIINIPEVNKIFPDAIFYKFTTKGGDDFTNGTWTTYKIYFKGLYYDNVNLRYLEFNTNKGKLSSYGIKDRLSAYATVCSYDKLHSLILIDSLIAIHINPDTISYQEYKVIYKINNKQHIGKVLICYNEIIYFYIGEEIKIGVDFNIPDQNSKNTNMNILNTDPFEGGGGGVNKHYYYFDADNSTNVSIEITGLNSNEQIQLNLIKGYGSHDLIYSFPLTATVNGVATYNYTQSTCATGVYQIKFVRSDQSTVSFDNIYFIPEHRIVYNYPPPSTFKYKIYYTDMFYNNPSSNINISENNFINAVQDALNNSWQKEIVDWQFCTQTAMNDADNALDVYLHDYYESGFLYHLKLSTLKQQLDGNPKIPLAFFHNNLVLTNDYLIEIDFNFKNIYPLTNLTYNSTENFIKSGISHEFFHAVEQTIKGSNSTILDNSNMRWVSDGMARFIQTVFMNEVYGSNVEFQYNAAYYYNANKFLTENLYTSNLQDSYHGALYNVSYNYSLFWRYLYEKYKTGTTAQKLALMKSVLQNIPSSYILSSINSAMNTSLSSNGGNFSDFITAMNSFAKNIYFINKPISIWENSNTYSQPAIEQQFCNQSLSSTAPIDAAFGISIKEISFQEAGNYSIQFLMPPIDDTYNPDKYNVNYFIYNSSLSTIPSDNIIPISSGNQNTTSIQLQSTNEKLILIFVRSDLHEYSADIQYQISKSNSSFVADFTANQTTINVNGIVQFNDASIGNPTSWNWSFPGGTPSSYNGQNPSIITYNTSGTYDVSLTISDGINLSTKTIDNYINITNELVSDFHTNTTQAYEGSDIYFYDSSIGNPTSWFWDFGDGYTSTIQNPYHQYIYQGIYNVSLTVSDGNLSNTETKYNLINISPVDGGSVFVSGKVTDNFNPISGVRLHANGVGSGWDRDTYTDNNGNWHFVFYPGWYGDISASKNGYSSFTQHYSSVNNSINNQNIVLYPLSFYITNDDVYVFTSTTFYLNGGGIGSTYELYIDYDDVDMSYGTPFHYTFQSVGYHHVEVYCYTLDGQVLYASKDIYANQTEAYSPFLPSMGQDCNVANVGVTIHFYETSVFYDEWKVDRKRNWKFGFNTSEEHSTPKKSWDEIPGPYNYSYTFYIGGQKRNVLQYWDKGGGQYHHLNNDVWSGINIINCNSYSNYLPPPYDFFSMAVYDNWGTPDHIYGGTFNINGNANNYLNATDITVSACKEIIINGDVEFNAAGNHELIFEINNSPCLGNNPSFTNGNTNNNDSEGSIKKEEILSTKCFPNPFNNYINIYLTSKQDLNLIITITDAQGKEVICQSENIKTGEHIFHITTEKLNSGTYILSILGNDSFFSENLIKTK